MKKVLCLVLVLIMVLPSTAFAVRHRDYNGPVEYSKGRDLSTENDLVYMDFSNLNPGDETGFDQAPATAAIVKTQGPDGNIQSALCITDDLPGTSGGYSAVKRFKGVNSGYLKFEIRYKQEKLSSDDLFGTNIYVNGGNTFFHHLILEDQATGGMSTLYGTGIWWAPWLNREVRKYDTWYTFTAIFDFANNDIDASIIVHDTEHGRLDTYTGFAINPSVAIGTAADNICLQTDKGDGKFYVDYIKVEKSNQEMDLPTIKRPPLPVPMVSTPGANPVKGITNIKYNGEYMYSAIPPVMEGNAIYIPIRNAIRALGFKVSYEQGTFAGTKGEERIELKRGSDTVVYNGGTYKLSKPIEDKDSALVSLTELANIIGATANYDAAADEYIITKEEAVQ